MQRPFILNLRLNELYKSEQDKYMAKKLESIKPIVNSGCPESFIFYNTKFHRPTPKFSICNSYFNINLFSQINKTRLEEIMQYCIINCITLINMDIKILGRK